MRLFDSHFPPIPWPGGTKRSTSKFYKFIEHREWESQARWSYCITNSWSNHKWLSPIKAVIAVFFFRMYIILTN